MQKNWVDPLEQWEDLSSVQWLSCALSTIFNCNLINLNQYNLTKLDLINIKLEQLMNFNQLNLIKLD